MLHKVKAKLPKAPHTFGLRTKGIFSSNVLVVVGSALLQAYVRRLTESSKIRNLSQIERFTGTNGGVNAVT